MCKKYLFISLLSIIITFISCKEGQKEKSAPVANISSQLDSNINTEGQVLFNKSCASCHGLEGKGDGIVAKTGNINPRNFITDSFKNGKNLDGIIKTLEKGIPGTQMVAWGGIFNQKQIQDIAEYVLYLSTKKTHSE